MKAEAGAETRSAAGSSLAAPANRSSVPQAQSKTPPTTAVDLPLRPFAVVGNPDCRRVGRFQDALAAWGLPPALEIAWTDVLASKVALPDVIADGAIVRIEAPGTAFAAERALLALGAEQPDEEAGYDRISSACAAAMPFDKGLIACPRQWYLGFRAALGMVERQLSACPGVTRMNEPGDIARMFDKPACQDVLHANGLPVPRNFGLLADYNDLVAKMSLGGCRRVFVKLAHGSSASGVVAYRTQGGQHQAITTVEMARQDGALVLYNTRRIQTYRDPHTIAALIDALCRHRAYAEEWIPKASLDGHAFDLRIVVIAGRARHALARLSRNPMTNLHLLNQRRDWEHTRRFLGEEAAGRALQTVEAAMRCFPRSLYAGLDLMFAPGLRRHAMLEINAFGDLLPCTLCEGRDTYQWEVLAALQSAAAEKQADGLQGSATDTRRQNHNDHSNDQNAAYAQTGGAVYKGECVSPSPTSRRNHTGSAQNGEPHPQTSRRQDVPC